MTDGLTICISREAGFGNLGQRLCNPAHRGIPFENKPPYSFEQFLHFAGYTLKEYPILHIS